MTFTHSNLVSEAYSIGRGEYIIDATPSVPGSPLEVMVR